VFVKFSIFLLLRDFLILGFCRLSGGQKGGRKIPPLKTSSIIALSVARKYSWGADLVHWFF